MFGLEAVSSKAKMEAINAKVSEVKTLLAHPVNPSDEIALTLRLSNVSVSQNYLLKTENLKQI